MKKVNSQSQNVSCVLRPGLKPREKKPRKTKLEIFSNFQSMKMLHVMWRIEHIAFISALISVYQMKSVEHKTWIFFKFQIHEKSVSIMQDRTWKKLESVKIEKCHNWKMSE